jgi:hypothetical protein
VAASSAVVPAGGSGTVTLSLETETNGPVTATAEFRTDDPTCPVAFVTMQGTVPPGVDVLPDRVYFRASKGSVSALTVTVTGPADMRLGDVTCLAGRVTPRVTGPEVTEDKARWVIELSLAPGVVGAVQDELRIPTSFPKRPLISVPIGGTITGDLEVRPKELFWGFVDIGREAEQKLTIRSRSGASFQIIEAKASLEAVQPVASRQIDSSTWQLDVRLAPKQPGVIDTTLLLTTDLAGEERIEVPVYADVRRAP